MATQFDPSVISQIPDMAPNPLKAQQDAYTLYDQKNRTQLNALTLQQAKEDQSDRLAAKKILQGSNLSTDRGKNEALEKVARVSPDLAMKMQKDFSAQKSVDLQNQLMKLQVAQEQTAPMISSIDRIIGELGPMKKLVDEGKMTPAELDAVVAKKMLPEIQTLSQNNPEIAPYLAQFAKNPQNITYRGLISAENQTKQGREMAKQREQEIRDAMNQQKIEQGDKRLDAYMQNIASEIRSRNARTNEAESSEISPRVARFMAERFWAGDKSALTGIGRNKQGWAAINKAIVDIGDERGQGATELAAKLAEFKGFESEQMALGRREALISGAAQEAGNVMPIALKASENVPRGKWVPINKIIQEGKIISSDPALKKFGQANLTLANVYSRAMNPTGAATVAGQNHALEQLSTYTSPEAYKAGLEIIAQEIDAAKDAPAEVRKQVYDEIVKGKATHETIMEKLFGGETENTKPPKRPGQQTSGPQSKPTNQMSDDDILKKWSS